MIVRTRFAPSPTGYLHIGGARTALFSWLYAKKHKGVFVLRVEDTDQSRSSEESVQGILQGMAWLGLSYDEGPYFQTQRLDRYQQVVQHLLAQGDAYRCTCSTERLALLRERQMQAKQKPRYDGCCREKDIQADCGQPFVVRLKTPLEGSVEICDLVKGTVTVSNSELDDLVIVRSDGLPTYNLTVVVDDIDMQISHVIRGDDHLNNTPRQIHLYRALRAELPVFVHVPMILGDDGKRLSKRQNAVNVIEYRQQGFLPEALLNCLVRLGWSHGDQEVFSMDEMIALFDLDHINQSPATFDLEKLNWLNQHYIKTLDANDLADRLKTHLSAMEIDIKQGPLLVDVVHALRDRAKTLVDMAEQAKFFYQDFQQYEERAAKKHLTSAAFAVLQRLLQSYQALEQEHWHAQKVYQIAHDTAAALDIGMGKVGMPLRVAVSGSGVSPEIGITLQLLGKEKTIGRLQQALSYLESTQ